MATSSSPVNQKHTNNLANEKSTYLLQHAHNPVDWYPWGDEAIAKARKENKIIFLSVGYSTCHWCHVMEKESFENEDVAKLMNDHFVNIKVDREERPDIDRIYMNFVVMVSGTGGWPMSVWLTPDLAPISGGTYFPPHDRWGMPGFTSILRKVSDKWRTNPDDLNRVGLNIIEAMRKSVIEREISDCDLITAESKMAQAVKIFKRSHDDEWGGFGDSPKFPEISKISFLFHAHTQLSGTDKEVLNLVLNTLSKIDEGGIHDHVFGGFARYAVDRKWHIPHFEKMLYDQGQLLTTYTNAFKLTRNIRHMEVADDIYRYICKDLLHPGGGFYSGEDADSYPEFGDADKIEGAFYAWTWSELEDIFQENADKLNVFTKSFELYCHYYGIKDAGNVEPASDPHGHLTGKNILMVQASLEETASLFDTNQETVKKVLAIANEILYEIRAKRPRPHLDTKILTAWNGLLLSGLSKLACIKDSSDNALYIATAKKLIEFLKANNYNQETKTLLRTSYGQGTEDSSTLTATPISGYLDDYAFLIRGLLDYYILTLDHSALQWAHELQITQNTLFWDDERFGYFYSEENAPNVVVRLKETHDGAEPSGNSMAAGNLLLLSAYFENEEFQEKALQLFEFFSTSAPFGYVFPEMMCALMLQDTGLPMAVVVGSNNEVTNQLLAVIRKYYIPGLVLIHFDPNKPDDLTRPSVKEQFRSIDEQTTVYICHNQVCQVPITTVEELEKNLSTKYIYD